MNFGNCGRWRNGRLVAHCTMAGTEECDFECPYRDAPEVARYCSDGCNGCEECTDYGDTPAERAPDGVQP